MSIFDHRLICYTIHFEPPDIPSLIHFLNNECKQTSDIKIFKIQNHDTRFVLCIDRDIVPLVEERFPLLLERGVSYNILEERIYLISTDTFIQELLLLTE